MERNLERRLGDDMCQVIRDWVESRLRDLSHILASRRILYSRSGCMTRVM